MAICTVGKRPEKFTHMIYEKKGSIRNSDSFADQYLSEFPDAYLDYDGRIIVDKTQGVTVIYFREDFADEESYVRLYNYIWTGNGDHKYYLAGKLFWLRDNDPKGCSELLRSLDEDTADEVLRQGMKGNFQMDEDEYFYRVFELGQKHSDIVTGWLLESEYKNDPAVCAENMRYLSIANHAYQDVYTVYVNEGKTVFDLSKRVRDTLEWLSKTEENAPDSAPGVFKARERRKEFDFLYDDDPDRYFRDIGEEVPFAEKLKERLSVRQETFPECLYRLMREKGIRTLSELAAKPGELGPSKQVISKWANNTDPARHPDKTTVFSLILAAKLDIKDAYALMKSAHLSFDESPTDVIVRLFIEEKLYDFKILNEVVFDVTHRSLFHRKDAEESGRI